MGKGDRRSRKGKVWKHSFGITRKRKKHKKPAFVPKVKKEKKVIIPKPENIVIPQSEIITAPKVEKPIIMPEETAQVEVAETQDPIAVEFKAEAELHEQKNEKPKKAPAVKKTKPAAEKKEPVAKKTKPAGEKKVSAAKKKPAKKKES